MDILRGIVLPFEGFPDEFEDLSQSIGEFGGLDDEGLGAVGEANADEITTGFDGGFGVIELGWEIFAPDHGCFRLQKLLEIFEERCVDRETADAGLVFFFVGIPLLEDFYHVFRRVFIRFGVESDDFLHIPGCDQHYDRPLHKFADDPQEFLEEISKYSLVGVSVGIFVGFSEWSEPKNPAKAVEQIHDACKKAGAREVVIVTCHKVGCHTEEKEEIAAKLGCKLLVLWDDIELLEEFPPQG